MILNNDGQSISYQSGRQLQVNWRWRFNKKESRCSEYSKGKEFLLS